MARRLWVTIVDNTSAQKAMQDGQQAALAIALTSAVIAAEGVMTHLFALQILAFFAVGYALIAWRMARGSAQAADAAVIFFPFAAGAIIQTGLLSREHFWATFLPLAAIFSTLGLLNGIRGASYLDAAVPVARRNNGLDNPDQGAAYPGGRPNRPLAPLASVHSPLE